MNPACDIAGYALAPASVIAPVTGMDIVWNTLIAPCSLGETLTVRRLASAVIIFFTATVSVFFRQINEVTWSAEYVKHVLLQSRTMVYALCFVAWSGAKMRQDASRCVKMRQDAPTGKRRQDNPEPAFPSA